LIESTIDDLLASSLIQLHPTFFVGRERGNRVRIVLDTPRIKVAHIPRAHPDKALTAVHVRNLRKPGKYCDGNGLYLVVDPSGAKRWLLRTVILGKRCDLGLGSVRLVSLKEAREEAASIRRKARDGEDPLADRRRTNVVAPTFKEAAETVHKAHSATFKNEKHKSQWLASLKADVFPLLGGLRVSTIQSGDVLKVLSPIWTSKPETARRLKQRMKVVFDWAKASGYRTGDNPVDGIKMVLPKVRHSATHHAALPHAQVPAFLERVRECDAGDVTRLAFEFLILTAARTSEVVGARWDEIDEEARTWTIPGVRIKAGREHRVPLSPRCLEILKRAKQIAGESPFVFPGRALNTPLSNMAFLMLLRRLKREDITAHGFRSSFRDWAAEKTRFPRSVCEAALAHVVKDKTEAAYFRSDLFDQRRALMDTWEQFATRPPARVLALEK
jgi:integrase